jgi:hypothetical protein
MNKVSDEKQDENERSYTKEKIKEIGKPSR